MTSPAYVPTSPASTNAWSRSKRCCMNAPGPLARSSGAGFPQSPARSTPGSSTSKLGPSPSPRQKNPRQRVKAPPPADRPIRRRYRSAGPGAPPVVHQGRPGPTAPPIPEPRPVSPSTGTVETVTASTPPIRAADPPSDGRAWAAARGLVGSRSGGRALPRSGIAVRRSVKLGADQSRPPLGGRGGVGKAPPTYCVGLTRARALGRPAVALLSKELRRRALPRSGRRVAT